MDATYTAFLVPVSLAFNSALGGYVVRLLVMDVLGSTVYVLDLFSGFTIGFLAWQGAQRLVVTDRKAVAKFYITHGTFWFDLIAILPMFAQWVLLGADEDGGRIATLNIVKLLRKPAGTRAKRS